MERILLSQGWKPGLKLNIQNTKWHPVPSLQWEIEGETVADFIFRDLDCWIVEMSIVKKCYPLDIHSRLTFINNSMINIIGDESQ